MVRQVRITLTATNRVDGLSDTSHHAYDGLFDSDVHALHYTDELGRQQILQATGAHLSMRTHVAGEWTETLFMIGEPSEMLVHSPYGRMALRVATSHWEMDATHLNVQYRLYHGEQEMSQVTLAFTWV